MAKVCAFRRQRGYPVHVMFNRRQAWLAVTSGALTLLALLLSSCTSEGSSDAALAPNLTGIVEVDVVIGAIERQDIDAIVDLVKYQQVPCRPATEDDYIAPPACPEAQLRGTPIDVFMTGGCHPHWATPDGVLDSFEWVNRLELYAVFQIEEPLETIEANHRVVLGFPGQPDGSLSAQIGIAEAGIVWLIGWCGSVLEQAAHLRDLGGEAIFENSEYDRLKPVSTS